MLKDKESRESYDLDQRAEEIQRRYYERKNRKNKENEEKFNWSDTFPGNIARKFGIYSIVHDFQAQGSFTLTESEFFLWSLSLLIKNIKLDSLWTYLEAM